MNDDFEIEVYDDDSFEEAEIQLPVNYITVGEIAMDDINVYIKQDVFKKLEEYSASDTEHELGSILLGTYSTGANKTNLIISECIEAKYTDASAATLTFTHESWDYIHKVHAEKYPELKILGWQHTHPGYGIFLSNYDMFIQENFFNLPFQTAYVIDPKQKIRGFFQWKDGKVEKLKGFYIYDDVGKPVKVDLSKAEEKTSDNKKSPALPKYITIALAIIVVFLAGSVFSLSSQIKEQSQGMDVMKSVVDSQNNEINELKSKQKSTEQEQTTHQDEETAVKFVKYTVKSGDTLYDICQKNGIDFSKNLNIIQSINGLKNPDSIKTGQILLLPDYN